MATAAQITGEVPVPGETTYRLLREDEWEKIRPIFLQYGGEQSIPDPQLSIIAIAECDGEMVGMLVRQLCLHTEPLWVKEEFRGKVHWPTLLHMLEGTMPHLTRYYVFAPNAHIAGMCTAEGMEPTGYRTFIKEVK